jgi:hypothetical protein
LNLPPIISTVLLAITVGLMAEVNIGQLVGSVAAARAGAKQSWAFLAGTTVSRLVQAVVGASFAQAVADQFFGSIRLGWLAYSLVALAGLAVVLESVRMWMRRRKLGTTAPATPVTKKLGVWASLGSGFAINIVYLPNWVYVSAVVASIATLKVGWGVSGAVFALFLAVSAFVSLGLSILRLMRPGHATAMIDKVGDWTDTHAPIILIWVVALAGVAMIVLGLMGLFGSPLGGF